jgi:hypothetical protein
LVEKNQFINHDAPLSPKKCRLRPQNGSGGSGPEKLLKIGNCVETKKMKEEMVGVQVE